MKFILIIIVILVLTQFSKFLHYLKVVLRTVVSNSTKNDLGRHPHRLSLTDPSRNLFTLYRITRIHSARHQYSRHPRSFFTIAYRFYYSYMSVSVDSTNKHFNSFCFNSPVALSISRSNKTYTFYELELRWLLFNDDHYNETYDCNNPYYIVYGVRFAFGT